MIGMITDSMAVVLGGILGTLIGKRMSKEMADALYLVLGVASFGMGVASVVLMSNMPAVILSLVLGTVIGVLCKLGIRIRKAGEHMERLVSKVMGDRTSGTLSREEAMTMLVTAIVLFCSSGTGIYGCLDAGMTGNSTILMSKAILDVVTATIFGCSLGLVVSTIAVPQFIVFLLMFGLAKVILPLTTPTMINDFKACGGLMVIATGFRIAKIKDFPVADMLPAMVLVMPLSALWTNFIVPLL